MRFKFILFFLLCFGFTFSNNQKIKSVSPVIKTFIPLGNLSNQQLFEATYIDTKNSYFDLGYFVPSAVLKFEFTVTDTGTKAIQYYQSFVNKFKLFVLKEGVVVYESKITGSDILKEKGVAPYHGFQNCYLFKLKLPKGNYTAYFKVDSPYSPIRGKINCFNTIPDNSVYNLTEKQETWNVVFGFMGFVIFVSLLMFVFNKEQVYLWFAVYVFVNIANIYMTRGFTVAFYKVFPWYGYDIRVLMNSIWTLSGFVYFYYLIPPVYTIPKVRNAIKYLFIYSFFLSTVFLILPKTVQNWHWIVILLKPSLFVGFVLITVHLVIAVKKKYTLAKVFLLAYSMLLLILIVHFFQVLGIVKNMIYSATQLWELSVVLELLIFTLAFVYKYHKTNKEKLHLAKSLINEQNNSIKQYYEAQERERKSIAENIHDGILQQLVSVKQGLLSNSPKSKNEAGDMLDNTIDELRDLSHNLMPKSLIKFGLVESIEYLLEYSFKHTHITYQYYHFGLEARLESKFELNLYRCLQELIQNTIKHSKASRVDIQFYKRNHTVILLYEDNGVGIENIEKRDLNKGIGINNITSRINALGGTFTIENAVESGIIATIKIKLI